MGVCMIAFTLLSAGVYEGMLGKYPIRMLLSDDAPYEGKYTYRGKLLSIPLEGENLKKLCEPIWHQKEGDFKPFACFSGIMNHHVFSGKWHKLGSAKELNFKLKRLALPKKIDRYGEPYRDEDFYRELLRKEMHFKKNKNKRKEQGITFIPYEEVVTKVVRSRIVLEDKLVENRINETLTKIHGSDVLTSLECMDSGYIESIEGRGKSIMREGGDIRVEYYHNPFLVLSYAGSTFCGGAHPDNYYDRYAFDTHTGEEIGFNEMLSIYEKDENEEKRVTPAFQRFLERYLVKQNDEDEGCYNVEDIYIHFLFYPAKNRKMAVYLTGMGYAGFSCETEPIAHIPIEELMPFVTPKYQAYFKTLIDASR
jgi:hypothetical protein